MMQKTIWIRTALLIALAAPAMAQSGEPSLADIAHKNRDQQKRVITNDDFPAAGTSDSSGSALKQDATPSTTTTPDSKKETGSSTSTKDNKPEDVAELKKKLESYQQQRDVWTHSAEQYAEKLSKETDEFRRDVYQRAMENDRHNAELFQAKIKQVESQIAGTQPSSSNSGAAKPSPDHDSAAASHP
jgi:hypothetical protein